MTEVLTQISAAELVKKILAGERDFSNTRMAAGQNDLAAADGFAEMNQYLLGLTDLRDNPLLANGVDWAGIKAAGLYFLGTKMAGANLAGADLHGADLRRVDLTGGNLTNANLTGTVFNQGRYMECDFTGSNMTRSDFYEANFSKSKLVKVNLAKAYTLRSNLQGADLTGAELAGSTFYRTDLRGVVGLDSVANLGTCEFRYTGVTAREKGIIEKALFGEPLFNVMAE